ncbi:uncharacterized protein N7498_004373 [Penicillium cinerascens]|uniref:N-acetylgalactosaminide beta-1,3-galactosyltransferase n=1 Tax=Penicillium cinerascens TaxID=70096 RepID=A0A9W9N3V9_9EURO|nr:uncharacterized protein N7498_004373 [Penicillium cinerascens]KAJ5212727.1 hypothetical protein N7498_004373 [Penicillium cinerascens]
MFNSPRRWLLVVSPFLTLVLIYYLFLTPNTNPVAVNTNTSTNTEQWTQPEQSTIVLEGKQPYPETENQGKASKASEEDENPCGKLHHDMEDVFVVLKTGATEALQKVPVQLRTSFKCVPNFAVFSDYEETINGVRTYDVLSNVTERTMRNEPEFEVYQHLQKVGRPGLTDEDFGDDENGPFGKINNPGWKLDKWKFLPMIDGALEAMPDAKWYVFLEADTYIVWQNLVNWLAHLDHTRSYYLGSPMQIGDILFGYGGAGVVLSQRAMQRLHSYRIHNQEELEVMTASEWAGDCVLARALQDIHIPLTWAWPMMMTSRPWEIDHFSEGYGRQPWCYPVISYHHMNPRDIEGMWRFERGFFKSGKNALLLHADVYRAFIHNSSLAEREDWDNLSSANIDFDPPTTPSAEACADACSQNSECLQFSFNHAEQSCKHASTTFAGVATNGTYSGWMTHRVQRLLKAFQSSCPQVEYIFD